MNISLDDFKKAEKFKSRQVPVITNPAEEVAPGSVVR